VNAACYGPRPAAASVDAASERLHTLG